MIELSCALIGTAKGICRPNAITTAITRFDVDSFIIADPHMTKQRLADTAFPLYV
jgi:hypothetical protein